MEEGDYIFVIYMGPSSFPALFAMFRDLWYSLTEHSLPRDTKLNDLIFQKIGKSAFWSVYQGIDMPRGVR